MGSEFKNCPYCGEQILDVAIKCKHCGSMLSEFGNYSSNDPITFVKLALASKYEILSKIGEGGMADVFKARQKTLNRIIALKVIHQNLVHDREFLDRFHREAKIASSLNHPNIVSIYDEGIENGVHYIAMEYLEDGDLHSRLKKKGRLSVEETKEIIIPIADALDHAHNKNVIHRDIKSGNILFTRTGRPVLTDFGIAHAASGTRLTQTGSIIGTPEYMSPEQAEGKELDHRSDLYSLGVVVYECLTGEVPFKGDNPITTIYKIINEKLNVPYDTDEKNRMILKSLIKEVLEKSPILRINSGRKFKTLFVQPSNDSSYSYQGEYKTEKIHNSEFVKTGKTVKDNYNEGNSNSRSTFKEEQSIFSENHYSNKKTDLGLNPLFITLIVMIVVALIIYGLVGIISQNSESKEISGLLNQAEKMIESRELSQYSRAHVMIQRALELEPSNPIANKMITNLYNQIMNTADRYEKSGDINSAIEYYRQARDVNLNSFVSNKLNGLLRLKDKQRQLSIPTKDKENSNYQTKSSTVSVPNLVGQTVNSARSSLNSRGLVLGSISYAKSAPSDINKVVRQLPNSGKNVSRGSTVNIFIGE